MKRAISETRRAERRLRWLAMVTREIAALEPGKTMEIVCPTEAAAARCMQDLREALASCRGTVKIGAV